MEICRLGNTDTGHTVSKEDTMSDLFENVSVNDVPENAAILDVREQDEWDAGHIVGARHLPLSELMQRYEELDPDEDLYIVCRTGGRSMQACGWLANQGYSVFNIAGGSGAWLDAGKPIECDNGETPRIK